VIKSALNRFKKPFNNVEKILDSIADPVLVLDDRFTLRYMNLCWRDFIGFHHKKHITFNDYIHPDDKHKWFDLVREVDRNKKSSPSVLRILMRSQEIRWCEIRLQSLYSTQTYPISVTLNDVTSKIQKSAVSKANIRNLSGLVSRMPAILYRSRNNISWSMEYISDGCKELTGYLPEQLINQTQLSFGDLIHPEDSKKVWNQVQVAIHQHKCFELKYRLFHTDGHYQEVVEKGQGIYSSTGSVLSVEGIIIRF